jgi:hypothetical protein
MKTAVVLAILALSACRAPKSDAVASKDSSVVAGAAMEDTTFVLHRTRSDSGVVYRGQVVVSDSTNSERAVELKERFLSTGRRSTDHGVLLTIDSIRVCMQRLDTILLVEGMDPLIQGPGFFGADITIANHSTKSVSLFPPSYGQYLGIFDAVVKFGDSTFRPILRTDIDYAAYEAEKIRPGESKSFHLSFSIRDMYDKDAQGHTKPIGSEKYERVLRAMTSISIRYDSKFDKYQTLWDGEKDFVERNPLYGKYTVLDLRDTFLVFRD